MTQSAIRRNAERGEWAPIGTDGSRCIRRRWNSAVGTAELLIECTLISTQSAQQTHV